MMGWRMLLLLGFALGWAARGEEGFVDRYIEARWPAGTEAKVIDDAGFLRRVSLDLCGRIPRVWEVREFLADTSEGKRERLVEKLLASPDFARHFAAVWRARMVPENSNAQNPYLATQLEGILAQWFKENVPWDQMAQRLLSVDQQKVAGGGIYQANYGAAGLYFQALENKPEIMAGATSRLFLGVNLECAQCHNHPTADWKREQFWGYAAFFSEYAQRGPGEVALGKGKIRIGTSDVVVNARFLDGMEPRLEHVESGLALAAWMTSKSNPYFAKSLVNKMWGQFFGVGLLDPIDEPSKENRPSHPELLDALAKDFVEHDYDLRRVIRLIVNSRTYQLDSSGDGRADLRLFTRAAVRGLSPEQIYDSLVRATGYRTEKGADAMQTAYGRDARGEFLSKFNNRADKPTEAQTTILQALSLMNGQMISQASDLKKSQTLAAVAEADFMSVDEKIEALFLATLTRRPSSQEFERFGKYVSGSEEPKRALADVFWVLLNTGEFRTNH